MRQKVPPLLKDPTKRSRILEALGSSMETNRSKHENDLVESNNALAVLVTIFPQILPEVFREMLTYFAGESSLQVVVEQLMMHKDKWVRGRWKVPNRETCLTHDGQQKNPSLDHVSEFFRSDSYKKAARTVLYDEFNELSKSIIEAVMAEQNYSYTRSRSTLQGIAAKSWRSNIAKIFSPWRRTRGREAHSHNMVQWHTSPEGTWKIPKLRKTRDVELDHELHHTVMLPLVNRLKALQMAEDWSIAMEMNEKEAEDAKALQECECCFSDTTFEETVSCTTGGHIICFRCLRQAVNEAIYGQSWGRNIDHHTSQIKCLAPMSVGSCAGCIPWDVSSRALTQSENGLEQIRRLESRLADEQLLKSQLPLIRCPFCSYAEVNDLYVPPENCRFRLKISKPFTLVILFLLALGLLPFLAIHTVITRILSPLSTLPTPHLILLNSLARLSHLRHFPRRFQCRSPICALPSCLSCHKLWQDPHICHESAVLSLRTTIESARTAALKRTCPRCGLGFIKESGCNKLTCVCGYTMCYVCRQGLGKGDGGDGYRHFCQHFRPAGGKCGECDRCDLYKAEDEDRLVKEAGEEAEREWRKREGMVGVGGLGGGADRDGASSGLRWREGKWTVQEGIDWWVEKALIC